MATVEQQTKAAFARLFVRADWRLFKTMAEFYFERAACLRKSDMTHVPTEWRLLARNAQKRLFIGIGTELLLKALYLKHGFVINRLASRHPTLKFPVLPESPWVTGIRVTREAACAGRARGWGVCSAAG